MTESCLEKVVKKEASLQERIDNLITKKTVKCLACKKTLAEETEGYIIIKCRCGFKHKVRKVT